MNTRHTHKLTIGLGALALAAACAQVRAGDYHVATAQDLQNALTLAAASSVSNNIYVTNGYYTGNFNYNSTNVNNLTILAEPGAASTQIVIDGAGTGSSMSITGTAAANITVQGLTFLRNCGSTGLGGLRIAGGNTAILVSSCQFLSPANSSGMGLQLVSGINATVTNCTAAGSLIGNGGTGIAISGITNTVTVQNCTMTTNTLSGLYVWGAGVVAVAGSLFTGNSTTQSATTSANGGGAYCSGTTVTLSGNTFTGNSIRNDDWSSGGGACCSGTTTTLSGNTFTGNSASYAGGGVSCSGTVTVSGNTFAANSAGYGGGAACSGTVTLSGNTFSGNSALPTGSVTGFFGGGAYCSSSVTNPITISGNTFQQNTAVSGGGLYASGPTINLLDNLVVKNAGTNISSQGGGIWVDASATLNMINNTVTGNTSADNGGGVAYVVTGTVELLNVYNNIIWGNLATVSGGDVWLAGTGQQKLFEFNDADSLYGVWDIAVNNIDLAPQFFDPVNGDYHLQSASPCRNAGTNGAPSLPLTDLDGNSRTNSAGLVDLGCYEFNTIATHPADTDTNFVLTAAEFSAYAATWKSGQAWTNWPNPIPANYVTRAGYLMTNGGTYHNDGAPGP